jgi:lipopolysaccharide transport system ATP-binding protein
MTVEFDIDLNLGAGAYTLTVAVHSDATHLAGNYDWWDKVIGFQIVPGSESAFIGSAWLPVRLRVERRGGIVTSARPGAGERT